MAFIGKWGERKACKYLKRKGFFIEDTNIKNKVSEIDIIAFNKNTLVFAEVKTRHIKSAVRFPIFETITEHKLKHIARGIRIYKNNNYATLKRRRIKYIRNDFIFIHYKNSFLGFPKVVEIMETSYDKLS
ncbi:MAG: YraN family protein [Bdellovibrionota bacterium]